MTVFYASLIKSYLRSASSTTLYYEVDHLVSQAFTTRKRLARLVEVWKASLGTSKLSLTTYAEKLTC